MLRPQPKNLLTDLLLAAHHELEDIAADDPDSLRSKIAGAMVRSLMGATGGSEGFDRAAGEIAERLGDTAENWSVFMTVTLGSIFALDDDPTPFILPQHPTRYPSYTTH